jgi:hypothetical protein
MQRQPYMLPLCANGTASNKRSGAARCPHLPSFRGPIRRQVADGVGDHLTGLNECVGICLHRQAANSADCGAQAGSKFGTDVHKRHSGRARSLYDSLTQWRLNP